MVLLSMTMLLGGYRMVHLSVTLLLGGYRMVLLSVNLLLAGYRIVLLSVTLRLGGYRMVLLSVTLVLRGYRIVLLGIDPGYSRLPQTKIVMYNELVVLLACENVGKFLVVRRVSVMTLRKCCVDFVSLPRD
jgi:hypothetical protein